VPPSARRRCSERGKERRGAREEQAARAPGGGDGFMGEERGTSDPMG